MVQIRYTHKLGVVCAALFVVVVFHIGKNFFPKNVRQTSLSGKTLSTRLNIVTEENRVAFGKPNATLLTQMYFNGFHFPMYLAEKEFKLHAQDGGYFDDGSTKYFISMLRSDPHLMFLDIGANLGTYSIAIAHLKMHRVIAIEPNFENMRFLQANAFEFVKVGTRVWPHITLLHNAVSDRHVTLRMAEDPKNRGNSHVLDSDYCNITGDRRMSIHAEVATYSCVGEPVQTITMDDLIPLVTTGHAVIKIDVQGSEINAFNPTTSTKFFHQINVPVIQMEWGIVSRGRENERAIIDNWLKFFYDRNYTAHHPNSKGRILERDWTKWPYDIVLKRNSSLAYSV